MEKISDNNNSSTMITDGKTANPITSSEPKPPITIRPLTLKDFEKSLTEISASVSEDAASISELRKWNEMYGEGGTRRKESLPYFL